MKICLPPCYSNVLSTINKGKSRENCMSAHVFLGHPWVWMGTVQVPRRNNLEILIPKHRWKSKIGPLEIAMWHFFGAPCSLVLMVFSCRLREMCFDEIQVMPRSIKDKYHLQKETLEGLSSSSASSAPWYKFWSRIILIISIMIQSLKEDYPPHQNHARKSKRGLIRCDTLSCPVLSPLLSWGRMQFLFQSNHLRHNHHHHHHHQ